MRKIAKHNFEAVSLLTVENGRLDISIIPAHNQPDWLVPTALIMQIIGFEERIWTYLYQNQEVSVYHLLDKNQAPDVLVLLEGNTDVHRLALQTTGTVVRKSVRINDIKDTTLPEDIKQNLQALSKDGSLDFMHQAVIMDNKLYIVPELDLITHQLVDLDS